MRAAIIGYGEIGSAVAALYRKNGRREPTIVDPALHFENELGDADVVHVCVPAKAVDQVVGDVRERLWIVHSTVPLGMCRHLAARVRERIVHAPVRGVHPNLVKGMETFVMPIGGPDGVAGEASRVLATLGVKAQRMGTWETTELAKLLCTLRYGVDILFMRHVAELCEFHGLDFSRVYTEWTQQYNDGYTLLGQWWFARPILKAMPGPIGGHCVVPNADLLQEQSAFAQLVAEAGVMDWSPANVDKASKQAP